MTENKLEGFEDFGDILDDAEAGGAEPEIAGELDQLLGGDDAGEGGGDDLMGDGSADSELDSFFEDLSTIDDLEVLGDDKDDSEGEGGDDDIEVAMPAVAAEEVEEEEPQKKEKKKKEKKKKTGPGFIRRNLRRLIVLAILLGGGYFLYTTFFKDNEAPWEVIQERKDWAVALMDQLIEQYWGDQGEAPRIEKPVLKLAPPKAEPPLPPPLLKPPPPVVRRRPAAPRPRVESGPWSIQVATCFFPSCLEGYRSYLRANKRSVLVGKKSAQKESLEIYSVSTYSGLEDAQEISVRINRSHPLEGHAYTYRENGSYRISMGAFEDLARSKVVQGDLNRRFAGEIVFSTRAKAFPYQVNSVRTGKYRSRSAANRAMRKLKEQDPRFKDAFVVRR